MPSTADPDCRSPPNWHIQPVEPGGSPGMAEHGRMAWQRLTGHGSRNAVEATTARHKGPIGSKLQARHRHAQVGEAALAIQVLNRMIREAKPLIVRRS